MNNGSCALVQIHSYRKPFNGAAVIMRSAIRNNEMKKQMSVCFFLFTVCLFHLLIPGTVFGQEGTADKVFEEYRNTFEHPDVHAFFPDVLSALKAPDIQARLHPIIIKNFANDPKFIRSYYPSVDDSIVVLLTINDRFQALFRDEQFHNVLQNRAEIDKLVALIEGTTPRPPATDCPEPEPPEVTRLLIVSGNNQSGESGTSLAQPFVVGVLDQNGVPLQEKNSVTVTFRVTAGGGRLSGQTIQTIPTDVYGQARTILTLGSGVGANSVEASVAGISRKQTFTATATIADESPPESEPPEATRLLIVSGNNQSGESGTSLAQPFVVGVLDQNGVPLQEKNSVTVTFRVTAGGGRLSGQTIQTIRTDIYGQARTILTLGSGLGANSVEARVTGILRPQTFTATAEPPKVTGDSDVNRDGVVNSIDLSIVISLITQPNRNIADVNADINADGIVDHEDLVLVASALDSTAAAPSVRALVQDGIFAEDVQVLLTQAKALPETTRADPAYQRGIAVLEQLLAPLRKPQIIPKQTALLMNYPNPFNPETWIPYQLSEASDVTVGIYSMNGTLIRTLALGHRPAGLYQHKSRAAYWDGRNEFGERVASGLYFYTLTASDFTATRKMLIRK